ncbi:transporter substrate-binding domain-containing protein [Candidatus Babeliales bacterium]|nr:transporter substrate-binding domain-containing protein [Candidatus Babeliales bacterium]
MFTNHRRPAFCLLINVMFVFCLVFFSSCNRTQNDNQKTKNELVVGMLPADAPFMSVNELGAYEGFDVDVAAGIAQHLGRTLVIKEMAVPELCMALDRGRIDMLMCGFSITQERLQRFAMVHYQGVGVNTFPLVFWQSVPTGVASMQDLRGKNATVGVLAGTLQENFARQFGFINVKLLNGYADIVLELQYGKITAAFFDEAFEGFARKFSDLQAVHVPLGSFESKGHGIALQKNNTELVGLVEQAVQQLKNNGAIAQFEQKWYLVGEAS